jgi:hypothetical protein
MVHELSYPSYEYIMEIQKITINKIYLTVTYMAQHDNSLINEEGFCTYFLLLLIYPYFRLFLITHLVLIFYRLITL